MAKKLFPKKIEESEDSISSEESFEIEKPKQKEPKQKEEPKKQPKEKKPYVMTLLVVVAYGTPPSLASML